MTERPLHGFRVIDCSVDMSGMRTTGLLAAYGAEVTWVEPPGGNRCRRSSPASTSVFNRNKRSVTLELTDESDLHTLVGLAAGADVFVETWQPAAADQMGIGFGQLNSVNPGLIYCSISGFGRDGAYRDLPAEESLVLALLGTMGEQAGHRSGPIFEGLPFAAMGAAYLATIGILAALYRRHDDGVGRHVETSLLDGALAYHAMTWSESDAALKTMAAAGGGPITTTGTRIVTRSFVCSDGEYIGIHTGAVGAFGRLMQVLGLDHRIPPSETGLDMGVPLSAEQVEILEWELPQLIAAQPRRYWVERLREAEVCAIEHLHPCEVFDEAQAVHNGMVAEVDDPVLGPIQQVAPPAKFPTLGPMELTPAPKPGQHTGSALAELSRTNPAPVDLDSPGDACPLLDGVRILDLGAYFAGPYSSRLLADLGADVIKVEPTQGDQLRGIERIFFPAQAGKRSIAANLKDPALRPAIDTLLDWADVVHHNLRPGAAERLGLDQETVLEQRPDLIYLYAPGWGSSGPHMLRQSFAPMMSGYVGVTFEAAGQFNEPLSSPCNEDPGNGMLGAVAILMALLYRQRTGRGLYIENPQLNAAMFHMSHVVRTSGGQVIGAGRLDPMQYGFGPFDRLYMTAEGWICVAVPEECEVAFARVLGLDVTDDERFRTTPARRDNAEMLSEVFAARIGKRSTPELLAGLRTAGVPAVEPVGSNIHGFLNDPDARRSGRVAECPHPALGHVREVAVLVRVSSSATSPHRLAPSLGEHTDSILEGCGYTKADIESLKQCGSIRQWPTAPDEGLG